MVAPKFKSLKMSGKSRIKPTLFAQFNGLVIKGILQKAIDLAGLIVHKQTMTKALNQIQLAGAKRKNGEQIAIAFGGMIVKNRFFSFKDLETAIEDSRPKSSPGDLGNYSRYEVWKGI